MIEELKKNIFHQIGYNQNYNKHLMIVLKLKLLVVTSWMLIRTFVCYK